MKAADRAAEQAAASRAEFIRRLVDSAPPLTAAQRSTLRPILAPLRMALTSHKAAA